MRITLVRHGATDWNAARRFQGHSDIPLNEQGLEQARNLAQELTRERFDTIVSSDLTRCRQTAEIICELRKDRVRYDPRWREFRFGVWEGLTWEEIVARSLDANTPEGGESFMEVRTRVNEAFLELQQQQHEDILIITHSGPIQAVVSLLVPDADALGIRIDPGSVTRISYIRTSANSIPTGAIT